MYGRLPAVSVNPPNIGSVQVAKVSAVTDPMPAPGKALPEWRVPDRCEDAQEATLPVVVSLRWAAPATAGIAPPGVMVKRMSVAVADEGAALRPTARTAAVPANRTAARRRRISWFPS